MSSSEEKLNEAIRKAALAMEKDNDFSMSDFTADKARKLAEDTIPELVNTKMGAIINQINSQAARGYFELNVNTTDLSSATLSAVSKKLREMGYSTMAHDFEHLHVSWGIKVAE
jgi:hypothetical protein